MKYSVGTDEDQYEPNSNDEVLKNKLGISSVEEMDEAENILLLKLYEFIFEPEFSIEKLTVEIIQTWHRKWLGNIYIWAGQDRTVNMGKADFEFAAAMNISGLLEKYEDTYLVSYSELANYELDELVTYLAETHVEFILIHPFREGNGRLSRLLMDVMATQAGFGPLDYSLWDEHKDFYFKSIQAGHAGDYQHIERLVRDILFRS
jgi:cell filamentation protein